MRRNAIVWSVISLFVCLTAFWACNDDDDKDDVYQSFAYVALDEGSSTFSLVTEKGNTLIPDNPSVYINTVKNGEWVIATYRDVKGDAGKYTVDVLYLQQVLTKPVWTMTTANVDSAVVSQRDPSPIADAWVVEGRDYGYINVVFSTIWMSEPTAINLVQNNTTVSGTDTIASTAVNPNGGTWTLDLIAKYSGGAFQPTQRVPGVVSFTVPLDSLENISTIVINYTDYNLNQKVFSVPVTQISNYAFTELDANTPVKEQKLQFK